MAKETNADKDVVVLFALFHDCDRKTDGSDPLHGMRGSEMAGKFKEKYFDLSEEKLEKLIYACDHHTEGRINDDPTIGTCWDADRLDLPRVGIAVATEMLSTEAAKNRESFKRIIGRTK